ncbi:TPA: DUF2920 family protein [Campylobacter upsaliensis]|nr:DUF2920 family protein [Campylobacter upsaliensis]
MLVDKSYLIKSCDDVELGIKRKSKLEYRISYDETKELEAIVFIIGGFGSSTNLSFMDFTRQNLAQNFPILAVNVLYHCFSNRFNEEDSKYSAKLAYYEADMLNLKKILMKTKIPYQSHLEPYHYHNLLNQWIKHHKEQGQIPQDMKMQGLSYTIIPANDEYQNYGIMPALDHIFVLKDLYKKFAHITGGGGVVSLPIIYGGNSYGGYLAHLIAKIAPWHCQAILDNSCSPLPQLEYIVGRELGQGDATTLDRDLNIKLYSKTFWTCDANSKYCFTSEHYKIRSLLNAEHLKIQAKYAKDTLFISYHSAHDEFGTAKDKEKLYKLYETLGLKAKLHLIKDEKELDKKFIRSLSHSLGMSDSGLFRKELPAILEQFRTKVFTQRQGEISYPCGDKIFTFKDEGEKFLLEIS